MQTKIENIPEELKSVPNWVCWEKASKIPKNPATGKNAQSNNPKTWGTFQQAVKACETFGFDGIGFEFGNSPYFGVDLDHCINDIDFIDDFVKTLESYTEISRSGDGIHIICKGKLPDGSRRKDNVEMYSEGRYFICTGNVYNSKYSKVKNCTDTIKILYNKYLPANKPKIKEKVVVDLDDSEIVDKARNCKTGSVFSLLYSGDWQGLTQSQSEADLMLCGHLAFWTACDIQQMDRIFRGSGLMRDKWDRKTGITTYGQLTLNKAIAGCSDVYEPRADQDDTELAVQFFRGKTSKNQAVKNYDMTDTGNAQRLYDRFGHVLKYSYNRKKWMFWTGKKWQYDESGYIKRIADMICEDLKKEAFQIEEEDAREKALRFANKTAGSKPKEAMIKECQHLDGIPAAPEHFDVYSEYLNCDNGVINLRNGELMPHDSGLMMSKMCSSGYDVNHKPPKKWLKFLDDITHSNKKLQEYIQKAIGYSITGSTREQCAFFLYGLGNNGKSTFLTTLSDLFGDYSINAQPETIMLSKKDSGANTDIARLKSARFVTCAEPSEGMKLNEGLLKQLTGGDKVTARFLYGDEFEYTPEFKVWVATNHKPIVRGTDVGIWRRIKLIPFEVNIKKEDVDKDLKYKLRKEYPQILAWAVEGCIKWQKEGLDEPDEVLAATADYKQEMDLIAAFVEQCVVIDYEATQRVMANELFAIYRAWAKQNNEWEMTAKRFGMEMAKKTPEKIKTAKGTAYCKIALTEYAESLLPRQYKAEDFS